MGEEPTRNHEVVIALLEEKVKQLEFKLDSASTSISDLQKELENFEKTMETRERKRLVTGVSVLGSVVLSLLGIIWSYRSVIFK